MSQLSWFPPSSTNNPYNFFYQSIWLLPRSLAVSFVLSYGREFPSYLYHIYPLFLFRMVVSLTKQTEETTDWKIARIQGMLFFLMIIVPREIAPAPANAFTAISRINDNCSALKNNKVPIFFMRLALSFYISATAPCL